MNRKASFFIKLVIGLFILSLLVYKIGFADILSSLLKMQIIYIPLIILLQFLILLISTVGINILLRAESKDIPFFHLLKSYIISWSFAFFVPGKIGDFSLVYLLRNKGLSVGKGTAIILLNKFLTLSLILIFCVVGFIVFFPFEALYNLLLILFLISIVLTFLIFTNKGRYLIRRYILKSYSKLFKGFSKTLFGYFRIHKSRIILSYIVGLLKFIIQGGLMYTYLMAFSSYVPFVKILLIKSITLISSAIPVTINGLGIKESIGVYLYNSIGVDTGIIGAVYIFALIFNYLIAVLYLVFLVKKQDLKK